MKKTFKNLKCVITGSFGFKDIGDEAMLTEDLNYLVSECGLSPENISLIGHIPDYIADYHEHPRECCFSSGSAIRNAEILSLKGKGAKKNLAAFLKNAKGGRMPAKFSPSVDAKIQKADFALVTGGGTINSRDAKALSLKRMHSLVSYFRHHGLPVFMSGQTFGPLGEFQGHDKLASEIVKEVEVLTVRDCHYSRRYLELLDLKPQELLETFDDAYCLPYEDVDLPSGLVDFVSGGKTFALCVTDYTSDTAEKLCYLSTLVEELFEKGFERAVFVSHTPKDLQALYKIRDMVNNELKDRIQIPDLRLWQGAQLKKIISLCEIAIGGRYHFIVFAGSSDTPFIGMAGNHYSYIKQDGFARPLGLERFILTEKQTWDKDYLLKVVDEALVHKFSNRSRFERPSDSMSKLGEWLTSKFG